jgi:hypothetical protein
MSSAQRYTVIYAPEAAAELARMKSKQEFNAMLRAVAKLQDLGERLVPPHMKSLAGPRAGALCELRPKQGQTDWRAIYRRMGQFYAILAIGRHKELSVLIERAQVRAEELAATLDER